MALNRYVLTATVSVPAGTITQDTVAGVGNGSAYAAPGVNLYGLEPITFIAGTVIVADPSGKLYAAIGARNLRAYAGTDMTGRDGISN
jgi:hypothetical protein